MFANISLSVIFLFGIMAILGLILTLVAIRYSKSVWLRTALVLMFATFLPLGYSSLTELLGRPKPISLIWIKDNLISDIKELDAQVVAFALVEDEGIYLYLKLPKINEPLSVVLPWNKEQAKKLKKGMKSARERGVGLRMKIPYETTLDELEPLFYEPPQPLMPFKPIPPPPMQFHPD